MGVSLGASLGCSVEGWGGCAAARVSCARVVESGNIKTREMHTQTSSLRERFMGKEPPRERKKLCNRIRSVFLPPLRPLRGGGFVRCQQSLLAQPDLQQVGPLVERGVRFAEPRSVRAVGENVRLRRYTCLDQRFVKTQTLLHRNRLVVERVKPERRWGLFANEQVRGVCDTKGFTLVHHAGHLAVGEVRGVAGDGADPGIAEDQEVGAAGDSINRIFSPRIAGNGLRRG